MSIPAAPAENSNPVSTEQKGFLEQLKTMLTPAQPKPAAVPDDFQATVTQGLVTALNGIKDLNEKFNQLSQPKSPAPAPAPAAGTEPQAGAPQDQFSQALAPILQSIQGLQTKFDKLSSTAVNNPPASSGGDADQVSY